MENKEEKVEETFQVMEERSTADEAETDVEEPVQTIVKGKNDQFEPVVDTTESSEQIPLKSAPSSLRTMRESVVALKPPHEGPETEVVVKGRRSFSLSAKTASSKSGSTSDKSKRTASTGKDSRSSISSRGDKPVYKKYVKKLRGSEQGRIRRRATPATKPSPETFKKLKPKIISPAVSAGSDPSSKRRRSSVRFDQVKPDANEKPLSKTRPLSEGRRRSSVRFVPDPDFILGIKKKTTSESPVSKKSSVGFIPAPIEKEEYLIPEKPQMTRFSFSGLPPEKGAWPFQHEPEGLALKFRSDDSEPSVSGLVPKEKTSKESILNLEFNRASPATLPRKSIARQMMFQELTDKGLLDTLEDEEDEEIPKDVDTESRDLSIVYPMIRTNPLMALNTEFGSFCSSIAPSERTDSMMMPMMRDSTKELLRGLLPGMEEEYVPDLPAQERFGALPEVLDVDNPLMVKFQAILKKHLLSQIERLSGQIQDLNHEFKAVGEESKKIAEFVYKEERFVLKQEEDIESFRLKTQEMNEKRAIVEKELDETAPKHEAFIANVNQIKKQEAELRKEKDLIADLVQKLKEMEAEKDTALKFSKSESENAKKEKARLTDEKLKQDFILWKLEKEVMKIGKEMEGSLQRNASLQEEIKCVTELLTKAEEDVNSKEEENKLLQKSIGENLTSIAIRDKELLTAKDKVQEAKDNWLSMINSINTYTKDVDKEMSRSEKNTSIKKQLMENLENLRNKVKKKANQKNELEANQCTLEKYLEENESTLDEIQKIGKELKKEETRLQDEHLKQQRIFNSKKQEYIEQLTKQKNTKNLIQNIEEMIDRLAEKNQIQEERITESENTLAKLMVECEEAKLAVNKTDLEMHTKQAEITAGEQELRNIDVKRKKMRDKALNFSTRIRMKKQKIKELEIKMRNEDDSSGPYENSASARKLKKLEKIQKDISKEAEILSKEWLEIQNQVLKLKEQRALQVHDINISRKHNLTMENSKLRNDLMIKKLQSQIAKCSKEKKREEKVLERWHQAAFQMNQKIENIKLQVIDLQNLFAGILKDSECEAIVLQKEHCDLTNLIQDMTEQLNNGHQDLLEWEKRWNLAIEAKDRIDKEREAGGEVATMRLEIHRMEVRYNQLKKAQEKMLNDLELCISRRDQIIDNADAREKRSRIQGKQFSRVQLQRKTQDMKTKIHQSLRTRREIMEEISSAQKMDVQLRNEYSLIKESVDALKKGLEELEKQIEEGQVHQHSCLETTVMRQRKCKYLEELKFGKYRCLIKLGDAQLEEKHRLEDELAFLFQVVESIKENFPQLSLQLQQIENTITTDSIYLNKCDDEKIAQNMEDNENGNNENGK